MSTRCVIDFCYGDRVIAKVYRHSDGYPDSEHGVIASLDEFFTEVARQTDDTRFGDPSYLAAKFVVWQARQYGSTDRDAYLAFRSVGVLTENPGDIAYLYKVQCKDANDEIRPVVTYDALR